MPAKPTEQPEARLFTYEEAAAKLGGGITAAWLRDACYNSRIPHTRLSTRVWRFTEDDLRAILEQSRVEPAEAPPKKKSTAPAPSRSKRAS